MSNQILLMGLPNTGKTSYLAALWYFVQQAQVTTRFRLDRVQEDQQYHYLNQISQNWVDYTQVPHTRLDSETVVSMALEDVKSGEKLTLHFPDLSGESFRLQWTTRQFTKGYEQLLQGASGAMLFINPNEIIKPTRIDMAEPLVEAMGEANVPPAQPDINEAQWNPEKSPTQVQLVDLLQIICSRDYFKPPLKLVVIISAWDVLARMEHSPQDWIAAKLPLLNQFLQSNSQSIQTTVFGISAQGGDYSKEQNEALQSKRPAERIQVVGTNVASKHDLTEPLLWLMR